MLSIVDLWLIADVSGQPFRPIFNDQSVLIESLNLT